MLTTPKEGLTIDGFTLGPRLHVGGFASVWEVRHPDHSLPMVMKVPLWQVLPPYLSAKRRKHIVILLVSILLLQLVIMVA